MRAESLLGHAGELLRRMERSPQPPDSVAQDFFRQRTYLGSKERRFIAEVTFATLRCWGTLEWCVARISHPSVPRERLLVAAMGYLGPRLGNPHLTPACAAALQADPGAQHEELWERVLAESGWEGQARPWLEGLWQAFCSLERETAEALRHPCLERSSEAWQLVSAVCSIPNWILRRWLENPWYGWEPSDVVQLCRALLQPAYPCLRVNVLQSLRETVLQSLREQGIAAVPTPFSPVGIRLWERIALHELQLHRSGVVEVQEEASQLVGYAVAPQPDWRLWDACAGAGGKALHLAVLQGDRGEIWATDVDPQRLQALRVRLRRARLSSVRPLLLPRGQLPRALPNRFHAVLVDAPCSGLGTVRRTPTLKWRLTPEALARHQRRQRELIERYAERVLPGGVLVYATCSLMPEENFEVVRYFLERRPEWELEPVSEVLRASGIQLPEAPPQSPECLLLPSVHGTDGFFIARLRRRKWTGVPQS